MSTPFNIGEQVRIKSGKRFSGVRVVSEIDPHTGLYNVGRVGNGRWVKHERLVRKDEAGLRGVLLAVLKSSGPLTLDEVVAAVRKMPGFEKQQYWGCAVSLGKLCHERSNFVTKIVTPIRYAVAEKEAR